MTSYTIHVDNQLWEVFKEKTPRSKGGRKWTLNDAVVELIANHCNYVEITIEKKRVAQSTDD